MPENIARVRVQAAGVALRRLDKCICRLVHRPLPRRGDAIRSAPAVPEESAESVYKLALPLAEAQPPIFKNAFPPRRCVEVEENKKSQSIAVDII